MEVPGSSTCHLVTQLQCSHAYPLACSFPPAPTLFSLQHTCMRSFLLNLLYFMCALIAKLLCVISFQLLMNVFVSMIFYGNLTVEITNKIIS